MGALFDEYLRDQRIMRRAQISIVEREIEKHLRPRFGVTDAYTLDPIQIDRYKEDRFKQGGSGTYHQP
jgi:hypothetical protein